ncbi:hypothetical protein SV13_15920 [Clostridium perfringens]|uniref:hypothetical protein n=1 Tax=Clostridium perfringens TaxID=1502 RepID=UPI0013CF9413|nr:hypothetical protein [Clostridium perfringens]KAF2782407.1 hypothetical protein SV13_15920 [Clostridium perfringens]HAT4222251.1 hypothetical protein [Clostridium perfringens]
MSNTPDNELYKLLMFYEREIRPYEFTYICEFGTTIKFTMEPDEVCHLIFGSLKNKQLPKKNLYKGIDGYNAIINGDVTQVPYVLKDAFKSKSVAFYNLPELLSSPIAIYFNELLVQKGSIKGLHSEIDGDFLLYKEIEKKNIHFFLKYIEKKNRRLVPYSTFHNKKNDYILNQKKIKIKEIKKELRINKDEVAS